MNNLKDILKKTSNCKKITIKNKAYIICTNDQSFVVKKKKNNLNEVYDYLMSRSFDYFPSLISEDELYHVYEYIKDSNEPIEQKALDLMYILSLLHSKTTFYKEVDLDDYKKIYEDILQEIDYLFDYYNNILEQIEKQIYMSPPGYLFARNFSKIYQSLFFCKKEIDNWYKLIENKHKVRVVRLHNNLSIDHYLKKDKSYLISWEKSKIDMPLYDLLIFYKRHYLDFDFFELFKTYESRYPLLEEEKKLLFVLMAMPMKIEFQNNNYQDCKTIRKFYDYLYITESIITEYRPTSQTN